ncbi:TrwB_AAD_bind domain-containing protein [Frankia sp. Hr75.2]|nr:TrwB_AAD_bind domain-containing protein [Frankia sp. Hr75.2]
MTGLLPYLPYLLGAVLGLTIVVTARTLNAKRWRESLVAYHLRLPHKLDQDALAGWLATVAAATRSPAKALVPHPPIALEVVATAPQGISYYLLTPRNDRLTLLAGLRAALPGVRIEEAPDHLRNRPVFGSAVEVGLTSEVQPLAVERAALASAAVLASLQPLSGAEAIYCQYIIGGLAATRLGQTPVPPLAPPGMHAALQRANAEAERAARVKQAWPLLQATCRIGAVATRPDRRGAMLARVVAALRTLEAPGVSVRRVSVPASITARRLTNVALPLWGWGMVINAAEAVGLGLPVGAVSLPGLSLGSARQLPPAPGMPRGGRGASIVGTSNYPGMARPLALLTEDRLRHQWCVGPTGAGKSTLLGNQILQDIAAGHGVAVVDPNGDLVTDVLARLSEDRADEVIVLDLASTDHVVGINLLRNIGSEHSRELSVDNIVHIMASLWRGSWGPRTSDVLRASLLTLTSTRAPDGSAFTLAEVPELLTNSAFRRFVLAQSTVPASVRQFWTEYEGKADADRAQAIGPSMNKLRQFSTRTALRLALGQSEGFDLGEVFHGKTVLVNLAKGALGTDTAQLAGALVVAVLWQKILGRVTVPAQQRREAFVYLDEFQDVIKLPLDVGDMLAQARKYRVGLILAHQYLGQLPDTVKTAVLGTARTQIAYQLNSYEDARVLARPFAPLTADELLGLDAYEIAMKPAVNGRTLGVVTAATPPLPDAIRDPAVLAEQSRQRYGVPRADVEAALLARIAPPQSGANGRIGRQRRGETL